METQGARWRLRHPHRSRGSSERREDYVLTPLIAPRRVDVVLSRQDVVDTAPSQSATSTHTRQHSVLQHGSDTDRRNRRSVAVHLMSLCASLQHGIRGAGLRSLLGGWTHRDYPELLPPPNAYPITVRNVADADEALRSGVPAS
jgi:hypothetical protein